MLLISFWSRKTGSLAELTIVAQASVFHLDILLVLLVVARRAVPPNSSKFKSYIKIVCLFTVKIKGFSLYSIPFRLSRDTAVLHIWPAKTPHHPEVEIFPPALNALPKATIQQVISYSAQRLLKPCWRRRWWRIRCRLGLWTQQEV